MLVRKFRLEKGWSQEQLAIMCDLSVRTIQRTERGQKPSLETLSALAAVFDVDVSDLTAEVDMTVDTGMSQEEERALLYVRDLKGFYSHLIKYFVVISGLVIINLVTTTEYFWAIWPALGWGIGVIFHGLNVFEVFNFLGPTWERKQVSKRLKK